MINFLKYNFAKWQKNILYLLFVFFIFSCGKGVVERRIPKDQLHSGNAKGEDPFVSKIKKKKDQTVTIDSFFLSNIVPVTQSIDNSLEPAKYESFEQILGPKRTYTFTLSGDNLIRKSIEKTAPTPYSYNFDTSTTDKKLDIFITLDDSESFTSTSVTRAKTAVSHLIEELFDMDWVLFLGGLEGVAGTYDKLKITKGSMNLDQALDAVNSAIDDIFGDSSLGDERVFRSLNKLAYDYRMQDRDDATHIYLVITDAPNCKDRNNEESGTCTRSPGHNDYHMYLLDADKSAPSYLKHMSIFGAYYRKTDNVLKCGNSDTLEVPLPGETLKDNSQYADLSYKWESLIYPSANISNHLWVGDLCAQNESLNWLDNIIDSAKDIASHRYRLPIKKDEFPSQYNYYNHYIKDSHNNTLNTNKYREIDDRIIVLKSNLNGTFISYFYTKNNYDKLSFPNILNPLPQNGTVTLSWISGSTNCEYGSSFSSLVSSVKCRHYGSNLYLKDNNFLPDVTPGTTPLTVIVGYRSFLDNIDKITLTSSSKIIYNSIEIASYPATAASIVSQVTKAFTNPDQKTLDLNFPSSIPAGTYSIKYYDEDLTKKQFTINQQVSVNQGGEVVICFLPDLVTDSGIDSQGKLYVNPPQAKYPCSFSNTDNIISVKGIVPKNPVSNKAEIKALFKGFIKPIDVLSLNYPPHENKIEVTLESDSGSQILPEDQYTIEKNRVILNTPLSPGQKVTLNYEFWPPLKSCYPLTAKAIKNEDYYVWFGEINKEILLTPETDFSTKENPEDPEGGLMVCLNDDLLAYNKRLIVGYVSKDAAEIKK